MNLDLDTERLRLRPLAPDDLDLAVALLADTEVMKFVGDPLTESQVRAEHELSIRRCGGGAIGIWCVLDRASDEKLGSVFLLPMPIDEDDTNWDMVTGDDLPDSEIEIGFLLRRSAWGKGYATEAARRLVTFAFEATSLEEIVAVIDANNTGSQRVLEKCGLVHEGQRWAYAEFYPGFRITRERWTALRHPSR